MGTLVNYFNVRFLVDALFKLILDNLNNLAVVMPYYSRFQKDFFSLFILDTIVKISVHILIHQTLVHFFTHLLKNKKEGSFQFPY